MQWYQMLQQLETSLVLLTAACLQHCQTALHGASDQCVSLDILWCHQLVHKHLFEAQASIKPWFLVALASDQVANAFWPESCKDTHP